MPKHSKISYENNCLNIDSPYVKRGLWVSEIQQIYMCNMEDEIHHGDESFHILFLDHEFLLVGPFVHDGMGAIESLISDYPHIPVKQCFVRKIPYHYRRKGMLGLRLFPIPGLSFGPVGDLQDFKIVLPENSHGG